MSNRHRVPHGNQRDFIANYFSNRMARIPLLRTPHLGWVFASTFVFSYEILVDSSCSRFPLQNVPISGGASPCSLP